MNLVESNKLMAEFLGWKEQEEFMFNPETNGSIYVKALLFHRDWNHLTKVIDKIMTLCEKQTTFICHSFHIGVLSMGITLEKDRRFTYLTGNYVNSSSKIETIYNICLQFIQWYNLNK